MTNDIPLTSKEKSVLSLIHKGYRSKEIAEFLQVSPRTVESHIQHILHKRNGKQIVHVAYHYYKFIPEEKQWLVV